MTSIASTNGIHEIHVSVEPAQIALLRWYCKDRKMKPILATALYGDSPNQLMISKFKKGTGEEVVAKAHEIAEDMVSYGLKPIRVKVEAMARISGAPKGDELPLNPLDYWEFHLKIDVDDSASLQKFSGVNLFDLNPRDPMPRPTHAAFCQGEMASGKIHLDLIGHRSIKPEDLYLGLIMVMPRSMMKCIVFLKLLETI